MASININTYAGELPLTPTTTSIRRSGTTLAMPKERSRESTCSVSSSVTFSPMHTPVQPSSTRAGVLGMQRISLSSGLPNASFRYCRFLPAAMLTIRVSAFTASLISAITSGKKIGFTAKNRISACSATAVLSVVVLILNFVLTFSAVVSVLEEPMMSSGFAMPFCSMPPIIAVAIFPNPINPIFIISVLLLYFLSKYHIALNRYYAYRFRCLCASYIKRAAAIEAFRDSTLPSIGILRYCPAWSEISLVSPFPSLPMRNAMGSRKEKLS